MSGLIYDPIYLVGFMHGLFMGAAGLCVALIALVARPRRDP